MTSAELKAERIRLGFTIEKMAQRLRLPYGTLLKYEFGQRSIPDDVEWRLVLAEKDPLRLADLLLVKTGEYGWTMEQELRMFEIIMEKVRKKP